VRWRTPLLVVAVALGLVASQVAPRIWAERNVDPELIAGSTTAGDPAFARTLACFAERECGKAAGRVRIGPDAVVAVGAPVADSHLDCIERALLPRYASAGEFDLSSCR
jgi:hypothetical protein